jgi:hypothetical protein
MLFVRRMMNGTFRWHSLALLALTSLALAPWETPLTPHVEADPPPPPAPPAAAAHPLDQPLEWLYEARKNYAAKKDYVCTLVKQERVQGRLQEQNIILLKFRAEPFSVNMRWLAPREQSGQEVSFINGRNGNKMRVNIPKGLKKVVGFVSVDPNDPRVFEHSRHTIYEAGISTLIEQTIRSFESEKRFNKTQVRIAEYTYNNRRCYRIETIHPPQRDGQFYSYRGILYLDKESKLPIRAENYDWPFQGGPAVGELIEVFSFVDLRFNLGLTDADFVR